MPLFSGRTPPILLILTIICLFTSTGDIFFNFVIGGFSVRVGQIAAIAMVIIIFTTAIRHDRFTVPVGMRPLLLWTGLMIAFIPNTPDSIRSTGYVFWLLLSIATISSFVQIFGTDGKKLDYFLRIYIASFLFVSIFGLIQCAASLAGVKILTMQGSLGGIPRINGFSSEPSYFAIYMIAGWGMLVVMIDRHINIFPRKYMIISISIITASLILSTSRTAIMCVILTTLYMATKITLELVIRGRLSVGRMKFYGVTAMFILSIFVVLPIMFFSVIVGFSGGLGLFGGPSHSVSERMTSNKHTLEVFYSSPIIGVSLGGIGPTIAEQNHIPQNDKRTGIKVEGSNVALEVLAASGIAGYPVFLYYIGSVLISWKFMKNINPKTKGILAGLTTGMFLQLITLTTAPNILRPYVWNHIAACSVAYACARREQKNARNPDKNTCLDHPNGGNQITAC